MEEWLEDDSQEITRGSVKMLREFLNEKRRDSRAAEVFGGKAYAVNGEENEKDVNEKGVKGADSGWLKRAIVQVEYKSRPARLILNRRPPAEGYAWLKFEDDGTELEASLADMKLIALLEG